jgi:flavin-binding protein dodecin
MEHKMSEETLRVFTETEIRAAIDNYRQQAAQAARQLQELERQAEVVQAQQHMINGAILAFESLLSVQVTPPAETPTEPPSET